MDAETTELNQDGKLEQASSFEDFLEVVSRPDPLADLVIDVEGRKIQTSKYLLANVSSKFRQMLTDAGAENPNVLMLPGTSLHAVTELLRWLLPSEETVLSGVLDSALLALCEGNPRVTSVSPHWGPVMRWLLASEETVLSCDWSP